MAAKTCRAKIGGTRDKPVLCGQPVAAGMIVCCSRHRRTPVKTATPGIFARGSVYTFPYRVSGRQKWESRRTLDEARRAKAERETDVRRGQFHEDSKITLHAYAHQWIVAYTGRTSRGFREETRTRYKRQLEQYLLRHFGDRVELKAIGPKQIKSFIAWLCDEEEQGRRLSDATVQRIMAPVKAMLATAVEDEIIYRDPAAKVRLPNREAANVDEDEPVRAMSRAQLSAFLGAVDPRWRTFFDFLTVTGVRISEAIALQWRHVQLTGSNPSVKIRQRIVDGRLGAPKSKYGKREIPIPHQLVVELIKQRRLTEWPQDDDYVFTSTTGTALLPSNVFSRVLKPAGDAADVPWIGFHTFRHTCASMLISAGRNILQISRWLGHHDPGFTLRRYGSLMDEGVGDALDLTRDLTRSTALDATRPDRLRGGNAALQELSGLDSTQ